MKFSTRFIIHFIALIFLATAARAQQPFPVTAIVDEPTIAGRAVAVDGENKLLPWPMPDIAAGGKVRHVSCNPCGQGGAQRRISLFVAAHFRRS
jgi:hypothetical protein